MFYMKGEEIADFFNHIAGIGLYDYIMVDAGGALNESTVWILENSEKVVLVSDEAGGCVKERNYFEYLKANAEIEDNRLLKIVNRQEPFVYGNEEDVEIYRENLIFEDKKSFSCEDGVIRIDLDREFGAGLKEFAEKNLF